MRKLDELRLLRAQAVTRRQFFGGVGLGLGSIALNALLERDGYAAPPAAKKTARGPLAPKPPMFAPKAKAVIYVHMAGSPSQIDLF